MILNENLSLILIIFIFSISIYLIENLKIIQIGSGGLLDQLNCKFQPEMICRKKPLCKWDKKKCINRSWW